MILTDQAPPRRPITSGWQIPTCERWVWTIEPNHDTGQGGEGYTCKQRATHKIRVVRYLSGKRGPWEVCVCRAHLADELDYHNRDRAWTLRFQREDLPAPRVAALDLTVDIRAYAHGKPRLWLTEHDATTDAIQLELFGNSPRIRAPRRTRRPPSRPAPAAPEVSALVDENGHLNQLALSGPDRQQGAL
ncbi:hypothetical protein [Nocardia sp. CY41]|uniref:hypothetical protein n=1 Tax=Nocardia sp. CY41 TaxID=2608686 RepID=UPI001358DCEA|nr:hypothetical protein [Nocardia sp. CY41]